MTAGGDKQPVPLCAFCENAEATWVVDKDIGDRDGQATVVYRLACNGCKHESSYGEPFLLQPKHLWQYPHEMFIPE